MDPGNGLRVAVIRQAVLLQIIQACRQDPHEGAVSVVCFLGAAAAAPVRRLGEFHDCPAAGLAHVKGFPERRELTGNQPFYKVQHDIARIDGAFPPDALQRRQRQAAVIRPGAGRHLVHPAVLHPGNRAFRTLKDLIAVQELHRNAQRIPHNKSHHTILPALRIESICHKTFPPYRFSRNAFHMSGHSIAQIFAEKRAGAGVGYGSQPGRILGIPVRCRISGVPGWCRIPGQYQTPARHLILYSHILRTKKRPRWAFFCICALPGRFRASASGLFCPVFGALSGLFCPRRTMIFSQIIPQRS